MKCLLLAKKNIGGHNPKPKYQSVFLLFNFIKVNQPIINLMLENKASTAHDTDNDDSAIQLFDCKCVLNMLKSISKDKKVNSQI